MKTELAEQREEQRLKKEQQAEAKANGVSIIVVPPQPTPVNRVITRASMQSEVPLLSIIPSTNGKLASITENGTGDKKKTQNGSLTSNGKPRVNGVTPSILSPLAVNGHLPAGGVDGNCDDVFVQNDTKLGQSNGHAGKLPGPSDGVRFDNKVANCSEINDNRKYQDCEKHCTPSNKEPSDGTDHCQSQDHEQQNVQNDIINPESVQIHAEVSFEPPVNNTPEVSTECRSSTQNAEPETSVEQTNTTLPDGEV